MKPVTASCNGQGINGDHCCHVGRKVCDHLVENTAGRRYACGLLVKYGSWEKAAASPEYRPIGAYWRDEHSLPFNYCEVFSPSLCCRKAD